MGFWADELIRELDELKHWPNPQHRYALARVSRGIALREGHEPTLRQLAGWDVGKKQYARFIKDPLPKRISSAFSSLILGREPRFTAAKPNDQERLDYIVAENQFRSELPRAARTASSEGEVWWRAKVDPSIADAPLHEWHSRTSVYPLWRGSRLMAVGFVSRLEDIKGNAYRHFEIHELDDGVGKVRNVLYEAPANRADAPDLHVTSTEQERELPDGEQRTVTRLGERVALTAHPEVEHLADEWVHGLPTMLVGRIENQPGIDPTIGVSDYADIEDWLVELCVIASIGHSNLDVAGRKRVIVPEEDVDPETGTADLGEQVLIDASASGELGEGGGSGNRYKVLEYGFNADEMIAWKRETELTALNRVGIEGQYAGIQPAEGAAESGVALRIRLIPSAQAGEDRGQGWDNELPKLARTLQLLDAAPAGGPGEARQGFGRGWVDPDTPPGVDRGSTLPEDRTEATERRATAVEAKIMSRFEAIKEDHPEWTDEQIQDELDRISKEQPKPPPTAGLFDRTGQPGANGAAAEDDREAAAATEE